MTTYRKIMIILGGVAILAALYKDNISAAFFAMGFFFAQIELGRKEDDNRELLARNGHLRDVLRGKSKNLIINNKWRVIGDHYEPDAKTCQTCGHYAPECIYLGTCKDFSQWISPHEQAMEGR